MMNKDPRPGRILSTAILLVWAVLPTTTHGQDASEQPPDAATPNKSDAVTETPGKPVTAGDPSIPVDHLDLLLDPLTRDELLVEAEAWRDLVKAKVTAISREEITTRKKTQQIAEQKKEPGSETLAEQGQQQKDQILDVLAKLREQRTALIERLGIVLDAYEKKGGDPKEFRLYASAVSGIKVEVTDANATWKAVTGWIKSEEGGIKWGLRTLQFIAILLAFWIVSLFFGTLVRKGTERNHRMSDLLKRFLNVVVKRTILFVGLLVALSTVGFNVGALLALVGGGAFIIGFALQDTLGNFAAGLMLLFYRPFDVGDAVEIGGVLGIVNNVSLVNTTVRSFDNQIVLVPNKQVWGQVITNITGADRRRIDLIFGIGYGDDTDKAKEILKRVVSEHDLVLKDPEPTIETHELGESSVNLVCRPWSKTTDYWRVRWDVTDRVKKEFDSAGITIPFPQRDVHLYSESANAETAPETGAQSGERT